MKACSKCGEPRDRAGQRYCRECHNAYVREWRAAGRERLTDEHRRRDRCRSRAAYLRRIGILVPSPCSTCDSVEHLEMHHEDYNRPELVTWLCRECHTALPKDSLLEHEGSPVPLVTART